MAILNTNDGLWKWSSHDSNPSVLDTSIFHCVQHFSIEKSADQDLIVSTSFGREGSKNKSLNLDVLSKFVIGEQKEAKIVRLYSKEITPGEHKIAPSQLLSEIIDNQELAKRVLLNNGKLTYDAVISDPISRKLSLYKANETLQCEMIITDLKFSSGSIKDAKLDVTLFFKDNEEKPTTIQNIETKEWNDLIKLNQEIFSYPSCFVRLSKDVEIPKPLIYETEDGIEEILIAKENGYIESLKLNQFDWSRPEFEVNEEKTALVISVDYPVNLPGTEKKLSLEIDGYKKSFVDDFRKFVREKNWYIEKTENFNFHIGENKVRIIVTSNEFMENQNPIQIQTWGSWKPLKNKTEAIPDKVEQKTRTENDAETAPKSDTSIDEVEQEIPKELDRKERKRQRNLKKRMRKRGGSL